MVGNCVYISTQGTGPFTVGFYEITAFTDTNTVTLDRTACSNASCSGGTGDVGGAHTSIDRVSDQVVAGNTVYVKNGSYNETVSLSVAGGNGAPITYIGYATTRDDNPTDSTRPTVDGQSTRANCLTGTSMDGNIFKYFEFTGATADGATAGNVQFQFCRFHNNGDAGWDNGTAAQGSTFIGVEADSNTGKGIQPGGSFILYSYVHDNSSSGISDNNAGHNWFAHWTIADTNAGDGFSNTSDDVRWIGNLSYGNTGVGTDGFSWTENSADTRDMYIVNCGAFDNAAYGFNRNATTSRYPAFFNYNAYNGNTTAGLNNITGGANDVTTAPSFTNAAGGDFTLQSGSPLLATGFPQSILGATGDYQWNLGLDQDDNTAAGSASSVWGF